MKRFREVASSALGRLRRPPPAHGFERPVMRLSRRRPRRGRVLLSLATKVYERLMAGETLDTTHVAAWQNFNISRTFLDLGFDVDVMCWDDNRSKLDGPYDIIHDVAVNLGRLSAEGHGGALKILHPMFSHWLVHNAANYQRHAALRQRRGISLEPARLLPTSTGPELADHIVCLGGPFALDSYRHCPGVMHVGPQLHPFALNEFLERDAAEARRHFVWLGGSGCVHKGLDLTLEAFAGLPDCELYVCSAMAHSKAFVNAYRKELHDTPNIHYLGWMDMNSARWRELSMRCATSILPSASEMAVTSLIGCMMSGLIPMGTEGADIDLSGFGVPITGATVEEVREAVCRVRDLAPAEVSDLSRAAFATASERFGRERYLRYYRQTICEILGLSPPSEWDTAESQWPMPDIERVA